MIDGLLHWLETLRGDEGFGGPSIGARGASMRYCGPAFDWRIEGVLDGYGALFASTSDPVWLDRIERELVSLCRAQLLNGSLRNSWFDLNPCEGGMPHEPAVMAAACRARRLLVQNGRRVPDGLDDAIDRFLNVRLLNELWSRLLHTFNDWLQSQFDRYTPHSVAAAIDFLVEAAELRGDLPRLERIIRQAADSLISLQIRGGPLDGLIPLSSDGRSTVSPLAAARCLPGLTQAARVTDSEPARQCATTLAEALLRTRLPEGGFPLLLHATRPPQTLPVLPGAVADITLSLDRSGRGNDDLIRRTHAFLNGLQTASGAVTSNAGYGGRRHRIPEWRDVIPCCGWQDKIFCFLSRQGAKPSQPFSSGEVRTAVRTPRGRGLFIETDSRMELLDQKGTPLFLWHKKTTWASICTLPSS